MDMLQKISKNRRYRLKNKWFDPVPANQVSIESPVEDVTDEEWKALVKLWSTPRHTVEHVPLVLFICCCFHLLALRSSIHVLAHLFLFDDVYLWHLVYIRLSLLDHGLSSPHDVL